MCVGAAILTTDHIITNHHSKLVDKQKRKMMEILTKERVNIVTVKCLIQHFTNNLIAIKNAHYFIFSVPDTAHTVCVETV